MPRLDHRRSRQLSWLVTLAQHDRQRLASSRTSLARCLLPPPPPYLPQIFPRHVVEFLSSGGNMARPANLGHLARSSSDVSILFMDVVGFTCMSKVVAPDAVMVFINKWVRAMLR